MEKITDKMLLDKAIAFCDELLSENGVKKYISNITENHLQYPLDEVVKRKLKKICDEGIDKGTKELSYEVNDEIDELWNLLIEKSVICLRFFDKREPFMVNGKEQYVYGMKKLKKYHEDYTDFEGMLYGSDSYYRDHVFHVIRVWLLGLYLILNKNTHVTGTGKRLIDEIRFEGEPNDDIKEIKDKDFADFRRENLGFIFQDFNLLDTLTIGENISLSLVINKQNPTDIEKRVHAIADKLGIRDILSKFPYEVSGGQKQRCACARALINEPKLILADEPTGALDSKSSRLLLETMSDISKKMQATILMVTHDPFSASFCKRILFLKDGKIFNEIFRGEKSRKDFFNEILDILTLLGGEVGNVR